MSEQTKSQLFLGVVAFVIFFLLGRCQAQAQDTVVLRINAESIRTAQTAVLNRILQEAENGDPAELLKLSQTLSTLQAAEGQQDALMVARAIEPQLEHLPALVQTIQQEVVAQNVGNMLNEFRRHNEEMLPMMRGILQVWGESLNMGQKVQAEIKAADELAEAEQAMADIQADDAARDIASTYEWKYAGGRDGGQVYQITRKDGKSMDAKRDGVVLDYFDQSQWHDVDGQYLLSDAENLDKAGVLIHFSRWDWDRAEPKFRKLEQVDGPRRAQLISN